MVRFPPIASGYFFTKATDNGILVYASRMNIYFTIKTCDPKAKLINFSTLRIQQHYTRVVFYFTHFL